MDNNDDKCSFNLNPQYVPGIKIDTWKCITIDLLKESYTNIINSFDFDNINIDLGAWKS